MNDSGNRAIWHLYVIRTHDGALYAGIATDVERRFAEHCSGPPRGSRYLRAHPPAELVLTQPIGSRSLATKIERHFKRLPRRRKLALIGLGKVVFDPTSGCILPAGR